MKRFVLLLDLIPDENLIAAYEKYHQAVWPEIISSIKDAGIIHLEIYRNLNRMTMIMETSDDFSFEKKGKMDAKNPKVQEWESLMWKYQQALPWADKGEKWMLMDKIFQL